MKHFLFYVILLCAVTLSAQSDGNSQKIKQNSCEYAEERAIADFDAEQYEVVTYGLVVSQDWDFDAFYMDYMLKEYNVKMGYGGCMVLPSELCYTNKMKVLLQEKFGDDFFDKTKKEAQKLYLTK